MTLKEAKDNGGLVWAFRGVLALLASALTVIAGMSLSSMKQISESMVRIEARLSEVEQTVAGLRGNYLTRDEANALHEAMEQRWNRRIDREIQLPPYGPPRNR